jgi:chromatin segregation and condensation protein Rec8/ScpA/Scc1 (kleisin family)
MPRKLKVFRTPIGFHDAYVAAPSRKAALAAWGSDADLFARGAAEEVTDPKLSKEPLAHPGEVIRLSRGDLPAHLKALPKRNRTIARAPDPQAKPRKPKPPPKRDKVDAAEAAVKQMQARHAKEAQVLERQLDALRVRQAKELASVTRRRDAARQAYREALERWSG